jgi:Family of unknown function (DUF6152)
MTTRSARWTIALAAGALTCAASIRAHHSMGMFDVSAPIWIKGTVARYEHRDPHTLITLDQKTADGEVRRVLVEGPNLLRIKRMGVGPDFLKVGDVIEICGFPFKKEFPASATPRPALHVHMLVMPDGKMRLYGAYGKLDNCVRPGDTADSWVEFLNRDRLARDAWCKNRNLVTVPSIAPKAVAEEIDRRIANPCG